MNINISKKNNISAFPCPKIVTVKFPSSSGLDRDSLLQNCSKTCQVR